MRGFRRYADKQQRTRDGQVRDNERDDETDGRTNELKLRLGHRKLGFVVSTELIKYCELRDWCEGSVASGNTGRFRLDEIEFN